jgi:hypothetical protein
VGTPAAVTADRSLGWQQWRHEAAGGSMTVEERSRRELQEALMDTIGPEHTDTLLSYLPPTGWADVATTRDVDTLGTQIRGEMSKLRADLRGEISELRTELQGEISELRAEMWHLRAELHRELRIQFYSLAGLMIGILALVVAASANGLLP